MKKSIIAGSLAAVLGVTGVAGSVAGHNAHAAQQPQFKYTVKTGDTLSEIGEKFNVSVSQLKQWNGLHSDIIIVDQKLTIYVQPQNQNQQTYTNNTTQYSQNVQSQQTNQTNQSYNQAQNVQQAPQQSSQSTQHAEQVRTQKAPVSTQTQAPKQTQVTSYQAPKQTQASTYQAPKQVTSNATQSASSGGSVKAQFLANGGTESAWNTIVMPESGGNPNAVSPTGYRGLGQTMESWGTGSVAQQTKGMINYANNRYGSLEAATAFRAAHGWW